MMRTKISWMIAFLAVGFVTVAAPKDADALLRLGVDALWIPLATQTIEEDGVVLDSNHELASFGASAHGAIGFDIFALGLKANYFNSAISLPGETTRLEQVDLNLYGRVGFPTTDLAVFVEGGVTTNPELDYAGYNGGLGLTYDLAGKPFFDLNLGVMGQYINVAETEALLEDEQWAPSLSQGRLMVFLGMDFSI
ncbi:hypothetical protein [Bradymonas sediminis]|uniref:Outer membrane protein beta-barrel domain-containing protein n=1 Tax=Bradymonas sediminis TaxID=1548548 RepID=A0A2Z4FNI9_9DELT|nr:hypothetical protein [Bradymonas sediminis]AWV90258.1 hypothetical protein DN745_13330 [Bradymonas sediminis]